METDIAVAVIVGAFALGGAALGALATLATTWLARGTQQRERTWKERDARIAAYSGFLAAVHTTNAAITASGTTGKALDIEVVNQLDDATARAELLCTGDLQDVLRDLHNATIRHYNLQRARESGSEERAEELQRRIDETESDQSKGPKELRRRFIALAQREL